MGGKKKGTQAGAQVAPTATPEQNPQVTTAPIQKNEQPEENPLIKRIESALLTYPKLKEGYLCKRGPFFDREVAEKFLEDGEELIIVERPIRK